MNLDPQQHLDALEQGLKQLNNPYGDRAEILQQLHAALSQAELALANFRPGEDRQAQQVQAKLMITAELTRGSLRALERRP